MGSVKIKLRSYTQLFIPIAKLPLPEYSIPPIIIQLPNRSINLNVARCPSAFLLALAQIARKTPPSH